MRLIQKLLFITYKNLKFTFKHSNLFKFEAIQREYESLSGTTPQEYASPRSPTCQKYAIPGSPTPQDYAPPRIPTPLEEHNPGRSDSWEYASLGS